MSEPEPFDPRADEPARIEAWRTLRFLQLGAADFDTALAWALCGIDLHQYEHLVRRGCDPALAARILA